MCVCVVSSFCTLQGMAHLLDVFIMMEKRLSLKYCAEPLEQSRHEPAHTRTHTETRALCSLTFPAVSAFFTSDASVAASGESDQCPACLSNADL